MAVQLFDLVDSLKRVVNPPGTDLFPDATDDEFLGALTDAFWEIRLYGLLGGFEENAAARGGPAAFGEGIVTPTGEIDDTYDDPSGYAESDLGRDLQQLIVLWASYRIVMNRMGSMNSSFRAKAGPVEFETANAATVFKTILDSIKARLDEILGKLAASGHGTLILDSVIERSYATAYGDIWWVR